MERAYRGREQRNIQLTTAHVLDFTGDTGRLVMSKSDIAKTCGQVHVVVIRGVHLAVPDSCNIARS